MNAIGRTLGLLAAAVTFAGPAVAETNLTVMIYTGVQNLPILAAQSKGFFKDQGLNVDVRIAPNSEELRKGLAEGRFHIVHSAVDNAVAMVEAAKLDAVVVVGGDNGFNHLVVRPEIGALTDIRGKTVAVDASDTAYAFQLYEMLRISGLDRSDYRVGIEGATVNRLESLQQSRSVAAMLLPPFWINAQKSGLKDMGEAVKVIGAYQGTGGFVMRKWVRDNPETLVKYLVAYLRGVRWTLDPHNKTEAIKLLAEGLKLPTDVATSCYELALTGLAKDAALDMDGFRNVLALRARYTATPQQSAEKYIDTSFYKKALGAL
jgi:ABC-type nitrate/sulfonate/bicarbonate transport system substrate-binding protein